MKPFFHKKFPLYSINIPCLHVLYVVLTKVGPTNLALNTLHMLSVLSYIPQQRSQSALTSVCLRKRGGCHGWGRGHWRLCSSRSS